MDVKENIDVLFENLKEFIRTETVVGQAIHIDDTIIVPFVTVTFGAGTGGGTAEDKNKKDNKDNNMGAEGSGAGAGARITPDAVLVIKGERVQLLPINKATSVDKLIDMVPNILSKITKKKNTDEEPKRDLK